MNKLKPITIRSHELKEWLTTKTGSQALDVGELLCCLLQTKLNKNSTSGTGSAPRRAHNGVGGVDQKQTTTTTKLRGILRKPGWDYTASDLGITYLVTVGDVVAVSSDHRKVCCRWLYPQQSCE